MSKESQRWEMPSDRRCPGPGGSLHSKHIAGNALCPPQDKGGREIPRGVRMFGRAEKGRKKKGLKEGSENSNQHPTPMSE